jgi:HTH-type transcriptional regulator, sugar sensing transcriptional regulator
MQAELEKLGLTKGESKVYLALLRLGKSKVGKVVKTSSVSYSKVYDILERLTQKGLVSTATMQKVKYYQAVEPFRLTEFIERKEQEVQDQKESLNRIMKDLVQLAGEHERSKAEVFFDISGLRTAYEILLQEAEEKTLRFFYPGHEEKARDFYRRLYPKFKEKKMKMRGIGNIQTKPVKKQVLPPHMEIRFVNFPTPGTIDVIADKTLILSWAGQPTAVLIRSKEIAAHFKNYFESIWKMSK